MTPSSTPQSLYESVGGSAAVQRAVELFYARVLADEHLAGYFAGVDLAELRRHQFLLLSQLLGGPAAYDGRDLAAAHAGLGITPEDYARVGTHLVEVLQELGAGADVVAAIESALVAVRGDVLGTGSAG